MVSTGFVYLAFNVIFVIDIVVVVGGGDGLGGVGLMQPPVLTVVVFLLVLLFCFIDFFCSCKGEGDGKIQEKIVFTGLKCTIVIVPGVFSVAAASIFVFVTAVIATRQNSFSLTIN